MEHPLLLSVLCIVDSSNYFTSDINFISLVAKEQKHVNVSSFFFFDNDGEIINIRIKSKNNQGIYNWNSMLKISLLLFSVTVLLELTVSW